MPTSQSNRFRSALGEINITVSALTFYRCILNLEVSGFGTYDRVKANLIFSETQIILAAE